jgi:hypothetical protein
VAQTEGFEKDFAKMAFTAQNYDMLNVSKYEGGLA